MATETITGTVRCSRLARSHARGRITLGSLLRDAVQPLTPYETWSVCVPAPGKPRGERIYQLKSKRLPKPLTPDMEGREVTIRATVTPWANDLGGYLANVRLIEEAE